MTVIINIQALVFLLRASMYPPQPLAPPSCAYILLILHTLQKLNFLFQVGLAYYRLGQSSTALGCFDRSRKEVLRRQLLQHDSSTEDPSLHYHR